MKEKVDELTERNLELVNEIDLMDLKNQELNDQINTLTNELNSLRLQNIELAKHTQDIRMQKSDDRKHICQLKCDNDRLYENYDRYHRAYLDYVYFIDSLHIKLEEIDCTASLLCKKFKLDRNLNTVDLTTIDFDTRDLLSNYLSSIEFKLDNLLLNDDKI